MSLKNKESMETILGLLLVLLPLVFKLVEKKLKASGNVETAEKVHEWAEMFGKDEDWEKEDDEEDDSSVIPAQPAAPAMPVEAPRVVSPQPRTQPRPVVPVAPRIRKQASKPVVVDDNTKNKEKIDPKKLVIYSEIMKPKF